MINCINNLNNCGKATSILCSDFSTLYIAIPHDKLVKVLYEIINLFFKKDDKQFITVVKHGARWINNEKQRSITFTQCSLKRL